MTLLCDKKGTEENVGLVISRSKGNTLRYGYSFGEVKFLSSTSTI